MSTLFLWLAGHVLVPRWAVCLGAFSCFVLAGALACVLFISWEGRQFSRGDES